MLQAEHGGVQRESRRPLAIAVKWIPEDWEAFFGEMDANLMRATRFEAGFHQRGRTEILQRPEERDRSAGRLGFACAVGCGRARIVPRSPKTIAPVAHEHALDPFFARGEMAANDRQVAALDVVTLQQLLEGQLRVRRKRNHHQAARSFIDAVDCLCAAEQLPDERQDVCFPAMRGGNGQHSRRFVDDYEVRIAPDDRRIGARAHPGCVAADENCVHVHQATAVCGGDATVKNLPGGQEVTRVRVQRVDVVIQSDRHVISYVV